MLMISWKISRQWQQRRKMKGNLCHLISWYNIKKQQQTNKHRLKLSVTGAKMGTEIHVKDSDIEPRDWNHIIYDALISDKGGIEINETHTT